MNRLKHRFNPIPEVLFRLRHGLAIHSRSGVWSNLTEVLPHPLLGHVMGQRCEPELGFAPSLRCYSFESRFHGWRFFSLHRRPVLPLHGAHVAVERLSFRWPLPHVAGSPGRRVISASLTAIRSSGLPRRVGLSDLTSHRLNRTALPCSHGTLRLHASGTNPGSIPGHSPYRSLGFCLPHRAIGSATSTTMDFGAIFPFTRVPACNLPVYASQCCRSHHARLGTRLRAKLCRGRHLRRLDSMSFQGATLSHPFVERLIGTMRREFLDQVLFWNSRDLERTLGEFQTYDNAARCHASLDGRTPLTFTKRYTVAPADLNH